MDRRLLPSVPTQRPRHFPGTQETLSEPHLLTPKRLLGHKGDETNKIKGTRNQCCYPSCPGSLETQDTISSRGALKPPQDRAPAIPAPRQTPFAQGSCTTTAAWLQSCTNSLSLLCPSAYIWFLPSGAWPDTDLPCKDIGASSAPRAAPCTASTARTSE